MQLPDVCTKFQTISSLTAKNDVWSARLGIYDYLPLLSLATKFKLAFCSIFPDSKIQNYH